MSRRHDPLLLLSDLEKEAVWTFPADPHRHRRGGLCTSVGIQPETGGVCVIALVDTNGLQGPNGGLHTAVKLRQDRRSREGTPPGSGTPGDSLPRVKTPDTLNKTQNVLVTQNGTLRVWGPVQNGEYPGVKEVVTLESLEDPR